MSLVPYDSSLSLTKNRERRALERQTVSARNQVRAQAVVAQYRINQGVLMAQESILALSVLDRTITGICGDGAGFEMDMRIAFMTILPAGIAMNINRFIQESN